ncbi:death-inducer obliterator 1 isoform X2 [Chironomus tepperi]|uniref:death-inducer obliterator 1 isoform X2 n=1 Tax=Chironomus tepperi TaxID=113505 RepID=UPI00391FA191
MSHSNFKLINNDEPINSNLVIIVNKNGDVKTDTLALQNLLTSRETPETGVTVIRETSPTPSISDEIEEDRADQIDFFRQQYIAEHPNASEDEVEQQIKKIGGINNIPHVSLNLETFYAPDQAKKFATDVLHLGGIENPSTLMPIDYNFRRQIVQNDHCYTPLTLSPKESTSKEPKKLKTKAATKEPSQTTKGKKEAKQSKTRQSTSVKDEEDSSNSGDEEDEEVADEEEQSEESFSETDDDNDMDFSVNDRFGKKGKKKRKYRRQKQKSMTFKDFLEGGGDMSSMDDEPKKKYGKSSKKGQNPRVSGKSMGPSTSKNTQQSTVRKISNPTHQNKNATLRKEIQSPPLSSTPKSNNSTASTASSVIGQISIQSAAPAKSSQEIEFVESIVKDLEKSFPETDNKKAQIVVPTTTTTVTTNSIPNIMQMMETNTPTEVIDQSLSTLEHIADGHVGIEEIGDALIAALGNEAIDELLNQGDLMNFDATTNVKPTQNIVSSSSGILSHNVSQTILSDMNTSPLSASTSSSLPKILNKQAPGKDPIKVVRNGRVITLPPIEAPATRGAKRRAQGDSTSPVGKVIKTENKTPSTKDPDSRNSSRRSSLNKSESGRNSRRQSTAQANPDDEDEMNSDASWNSEDDPDRLWCICKQPHNNRFMICCDKCEDWFHGTCVNVTKAMGKDMEKKKIKWHCPNCKSNAGAVLKKDPNKKTLNQQKLTKFFSKHSKELTDEDIPKDNDSLMCAVCHKQPARTDSIYCSEDCIRNHATKHLDDNTQPKTPTTPTSTKPNAGDGKRGNVLKDQSGNVIVYDRVSGKLLSSKLWPHFTNLGQWLSQNPNCEPVKPGSHQANQLLSKVSKNAQQPTTPTVSSPKEAITSTSSHPPTTPHAATKHHHHHPPPVIPADELFSNPVKINTGAKEVVPPPVVKKSMSVQSPAINRSNSNNNANKTTPARPPLTKQSSVSSSTSSKSVSSPKVQPETKKIKRQISDEKPQAQSTPSNSKLKIEYERQNVRTNLKSTLIQRMKDIEDSSVPKMKDEEIEKFATSIEHEMFRFFNKDTRDKYKVKFRSLKFNLSDTKNKTLIERICMKKLTPKQLVELPSSELASKELSKWREEENKHQLEIITKAELDALAQTKMVIKTHKGEEILETKNASADISLPEEDIESAIDKTVLSIEDPHHKYDLSRSISLNVSGNHSVSSPLSSPSISSSTGRKSESHHNDSHSRSRSKSRGRDHHHHHHKSSSKHKKNEHRHRSRSPKHHHSSHHHSRDKSHEHEHHSRDKSREKSLERDHNKKRSEDHHHHHHRDKSRSNEKEKEREKTNSKSKDRETQKDSKKHHHTHNKDTKEAVVVKKEKEEPKENIKLIPEIKPEQKDVDIVGKILDSMGVHLDTKLKTEDDKTAITDEIKSEVTSSSLNNDILPVSLEPVNEHQLEIEIYSGNMYMADVAKFDVTASVVSGNVDDIIKLFAPQMEIVGRIEPKTVWDYLGKVKKLPGKELAVIRFSSTDEAAYFSLFSYLHSRQRYGVIKSPAPNIKDFYLITVEAIRPLPPVLLPIVGPGFIEGDEHKPDLLLGVILKLTPEARNVQKKVPTVKKSAKTPKPVEHNVPIKILPTKHKQHSHCSSSKLTMGLPEVESGHMKSSPKTSHSSRDDDEPYEPLDEDSLTPPQVYSQHKPAAKHHGHHSGSGGKLNTSDDLESQMEQLNREIERRQMEIQTLAQQKALELNEEQATKIFEKIRVPHNLSEILSTIKASEPKPMEIDEDDEDEEYVPISGAAKGGMHEYRPSSSYPNVMQQQAPIVNSMMDIDERINLFRQEMPMNNMTAVPEQPSRLASMSDADLLALVPEDALQAPPPPIISSNSISEPAIPGLEYEMEQ